MSKKPKAFMCVGQTSRQRQSVFRPDAWLLWCSAHVVDQELRLIAEVAPVNGFTRNCAAFVSLTLSGTAACIRKAGAAADWWVSKRDGSSQRPVFSMRRSAVRRLSVGLQRHEQTPHWQTTAVQLAGDSGLSISYRCRWAHEVLNLRHGQQHTCGPVTSLQVLG